MEEQQAAQDNRFLKGRQIFYMVYDKFKISGAGEALLGVNELLKVHFYNDNAQVFHTRWDEVLLSMSKVTEEDVLENL